MPNWKKVIVSGSNASLSTLNVASGLTATGSSIFSGSLTVTGSTNIVGNTGTTLLSTNADTLTFTGSIYISGSTVQTGSLSITSITSSLFGTASFAVTSSQALTSSFVTSSNVFGPYGSNSVISSSYALTASYASNIEISGAISNVDYIDFDTSVAFTNLEGRLGWDNGENTLQLGLEGGNVQLSIGEQMYQYCYNAQGAILTKGQVVLISGSQGNQIAVKLADNSGDPSSAGTLGFVAETIAIGGSGWIITEGNLKNLNTLGLPAGALLYLGATPGTYTTTIPTAPSHSVRLGYVERVSATVGSIYVKIDNGYELGELHDVVDSTTTGSYGDLLVKSGSIWINSKQLTGSYGLTGSLTFVNGGITGSLQGTSSFATQAITSSYADGFTVNNNAVISGSLTILQNLTVFGSASITYLSESTLNIGTNLITVNTNTPAIRFGGLAVIDSGSSPQVSGSWLFDSQQNRWIFVHQQTAGSALTSSIGIMGPETYNNLGNETQITLNRLTKGYSGASGEHIGDSQISDDGTTVSIPNILIVTGSITGSLFGTASYATQALSSSFAINATTSSNIQGGTTNYIPVWKTATSLSSSGFYQDSNNNNYIGLFNTVPTYSFDVNGVIRAQSDLRGQQKVYFPSLTDGSPSTQVVIWDSAQGQLFYTGSSALSVATASYVLNAVSASYATQALSASFSNTASFVTTLNQDVLITGSLTIGSGSIGSGENTLVIGPSPAGGAGEGGQILLSAKGDSGYTSASMLDTYQNRFRILRGTNAASDAEPFILNLHTGQITVNQYTSLNSFPATGMSTKAFLGIDSGGNVITVNSISSSLGVGTTGSAVIGRIDAANDVVAFATSDQNLKKNIKPIKNAIEKIEQIGGYTFDWKKDKKNIHGFSGHDIGVIAQEIEAVLPEVVTTRENGYKAVRYEKIIPLLIEAIKEQQNKINELENLLKQIK